jgi:small subunit ribosomal protein S8e
MTKWMKHSKRKATGGIRQEGRKNKRYARAKDFIPTRIGERVVKVKRVMGGNEKRLLTKIDKINISGKGVGEIKSVVESKADTHFVRRNIITKGVIVETSLGKARVTSRPGQHGVVNGVLIES